MPPARALPPDPDPATPPRSAQRNGPLAAARRLGGACALCTWVAVQPACGAPTSGQPPRQVAPRNVTGQQEAEPSAAHAPVTPDAAAARLAALRRRLDWLGRDSMAFWKAHGIDAEHGGVHGTLNRKGDPVSPTDKGLIQQARHLWTFCIWYERREPTAELRDRADSVYRFLIDHFRDPKDGEFFFKVSRDGTLVNAKKQLYAESFAIYALAQYAATFDVPEAARAALQTFRSLDRRAHDPVFMGYDQRSDPGFLAPGAEKGTNTHLHLLEAFTALYRLHADPLVRARLQELVEVATAKVIQPQGYGHQEFLRDWKPHGEPVMSYGHDLELVWLLLDALDALGGPPQPGVVAAALRLGEHAAAQGYDAALGGYFERGQPGAGPTGRDKVWWIQAEALPALWQLYQLTAQVTQLARLEHTLLWIEQHQRDQTHGEWHSRIGPDGSPVPHAHQKGSEWKASYHNIRALVSTSDWMKQADRSSPYDKLEPSPAH